MNIKLRIISVLLILCTVVSVCVSCTESDSTPTPLTTESTGSRTAEPSQTTAISTATADFIDYASELKLDMSSETAKHIVTVKSYIDGDTTHFNIPSTVISTGVLKARYIAINTPESTGKIEEWGKAASEFTKEKLSKATSIIAESDTSGWDADSTGSRYLVWIWYKTGESSEYKNLNIEILQNGLAIASSSANNRYGGICMSAINQARAFKLNIYSGEKDPNFPYGEAQEVTLKELRTNIESYNGCKVAFEGVITKDYNNGVYIEDYDAETDMYYGIYIYYGFSASGDILNILAEGNRSRIVGTVSYYETGGTYQVSGLSYRAIKPNDPGNVQLISSGNEAGYKETTPDTFANGKLEIETEDGETGEIVKTSVDYAKLAMASSISMQSLTVKDIYTTSNEDSSSKGAMTLTCECGGITVDVRTAVLYDKDGKVITASAYEGKIIDVKGIVDYFEGTYQIKVFSANDITVIG